MSIKATASLRMIVQKLQINGHIGTGHPVLYREDDCTICRSNIYYKVRTMSPVLDACPMSLWFYIIDDVRLIGKRYQQYKHLL